MKISIQTTSDGSPTLYREDIDEHYHSVKGALAESQHVYIDCGWRKAVSLKNVISDGNIDSIIHRAIRVFEVGFGSGFNAALTSLDAKESECLTEYFSVELFPLPSSTIDNIIDSIPEYKDSDNFKVELKLVNQSPWNRKFRINKYFNLHKIEDNLLLMNIPIDLDVIYFDAFAPEKQPEMWNESIFRKLFEAIRPGGVLTTYCAKGRIRRMLQQVGFTTERLPGPPGGKREILRATKPS